MKRVNTDVAYDYLRAKILSGSFPPGHCLMTAVLAPEIGVSRTPVRDALRKLEADGLVTIQARQGARVKRMALTEYRELSELRLVLESHAAAQAARLRTAADLAAIRVSLEAMRDLTRRVIAARQRAPLQRELALEDARFHLAIIAAAQNRAMQREIVRLQLINRVLAGPAGAAEDTGDDFAARRREVLAGHETIFAAIARRDVAAARSAMEAHIQDMIDHALHAWARAEADAGRQPTPAELAYLA